MSHQEPLIFDKTGQPISVKRWAELRWGENGKVSDYARVGYDEVQGLRVSTVWIGLDDRFGRGDGGPITTKLQCPNGDYIAIVDRDLLCHVGLMPPGTRHGLSWEYVPALDLVRIRARCFKRRCRYDGSFNVRVLCSELATALLRGDRNYRLSHRSL